MNEPGIFEMTPNIRRVAHALMRNVIPRAWLMKIMTSLIYHKRPGTFPLTTALYQPALMETDQSSPQSAGGLL